MCELLGISKGGCEDEWVGDWSPFITAWLLLRPPPPPPPSPLVREEVRFPLLEAVCLLTSSPGRLCSMA